MEPAFYGLIAAGLGVWFRFGLGLTAATLRIGRILADTSSGTGLQDAITPPISTKLTFTCWGSILYFFYHTHRYGGGSHDLIVVFLIFAGSAFFSGIMFIPAPTSAYWIRMIFRSLTVRAADYQKQGDVMRSGAALELVHMLDTKLGHRL